MLDSHCLSPYKVLTPTTCVCNLESSICGWELKGKHMIVFFSTSSLYFAKLICMFVLCQCYYGTWYFFTETSVCFYYALYHIFFLSWLLLSYLLQFFFFGRFNTGNIGFEHHLLLNTWYIFCHWHRAINTSVHKR